MTAVILIFIIYFVAIAASMWQFDKLCKFEFENHKDDWENDGKPQGFFWWHAETVRYSFTATFARSRCCLYWLFIKPSWTKGNPDIEKTLILYRLLNLLSLVVLGCCGLAAMYFAK